MGTMAENWTKTEIKRSHREWRRRTTRSLAVILDGLSNPYNVGAIIRTAAALGLDRMYFAGSTPTVSDPKVKKLSLGTQRHVTMVADCTVAEALDDARKSGFRPVGLELAKGAEPLFSAERLTDSDIALVIGNEAHGLSKDAQAGCTDRIFVPMIGNVASLNVSTAFAVAAYECRRRDWSAGDEAEDAAAR